MVFPITGGFTAIQFCGEYLEKSETFVYSQVASFRRIQPVVMSHGPVRNLDLFPLGEIPLIQVLPAPRSLRRLAGAAGWRILGKAWLEKRDWGRAAAAAKDYGPGLIHAHMGPSGYLALPLQDRLKIPLATTFYGRDASVKDTFWNRMEVLNRSEVVLVEGGCMRQRIVGCGCSPEKVYVQRLMLRLENYAFREARSAPAVPKLLSAARFTEKKGLIYALEACRILRDRDYAFEYRIIGSGPLGAELEGYVDRYGLRDRVRFLGFLDHGNYLRELRDADIFVQPSVTAADGDSEGGAPTTILEAEAFGLPVVATTHMDIPNIVDAGNSGLLAPERDSETLAGHIGELIRNPARWTEMGRAGRRFVEAHHDARKEIERLEDLYLSIAQHPN